MVYCKTTFAVAVVYFTFAVNYLSSCIGLFSWSDPVYPSIVSEAGIDDIAEYGAEGIAKAY